MKTFIFFICFVFVHLESRAQTGQKIWGVYDAVYKYNNDYAKVVVEKHRSIKLNNTVSDQIFEKKWGIIDSSRNLIADTVYDYVSDIQDGGVFILVRRDSIGLMDTNGRLISPFIYRTDPELWPSPSFGCGLLPVVIYNPKVPYFIHRRRGDLQYDKFNKKTGFINAKGDMVIKAVYSLSGAFSAYNAGIYSLKKGYYVFHDNRCTVIDKGSHIIIDTTGKELEIIACDTREYFAEWNGFILYRQWSPDDYRSCEYAFVNPVTGNIAFNTTFTRVEIKNGVPYTNLGILDKNGNLTNP